MAVPAKGGSTADLIVPPKALEQIRRLFAADDALEIARSDNHIGFRAGGTLVFSRLIEGPYPNYEQVIPRENDKVATADKAAMAAALRRMSVVASDQTRSEEHTSELQSRVDLVCRLLLEKKKKKKKRLKNTH